MNFRWIAVLGLAVLLMGAAPPEARRMAPDSTWGRIVESARRFVRDPLGRAKTSPPSLPPELQADGKRAGSAFAPEAESIPQDNQVKPATAVEKVAPTERLAAKPKKSARGSLFSRQRQPSRPLSKFMAEEKP